MWLTTVTPSGAPLPRPVGFRWVGGDNVFVYSERGARIRNITSNPKVTLNFRGDANGGDIVILSGAAQVDESRPSAARYPVGREVRHRVGACGHDRESFSERFSVPVHIHLTAVHGF